MQNLMASASSNFFTSPNYPNNYDNYLDCSWTISAPNGHIVSIIFHAFDVSKRKNNMATYAIIGC